MGLSDEEKEAIIKYRFDRSMQTFKEAKDNALLNNWNLAVNRLYYSVFYPAMAINLKNNEAAKTHTGTYNLFNKKYIATGIFHRDEGIVYRQLFSMRQTGDYDDLFDWSEEDVMPLIPRVEHLLNRMKFLLSSD